MNMTRVNTDVILQNEHKYAVIPKIFDKSFGQKRDQIGAKWRPDPEQDQTQTQSPPSRVPEKRSPDRPRVQTRTWESEGAENARVRAATHVRRSGSRPHRQAVRHIASTHGGEGEEQREPRDLTSALCTDRRCPSGAARGRCGARALARRPGCQPSKLGLEAARLSCIRSWR